jgi:mRNA-degrading endonuclease RelE of RelBE toxin-antitoxin system
MPYPVLMTAAAHKMLKKLPPQVRTHVIRQTQALKDNPYLGEHLHGEFKRFYSLHMKFQNVQYRVGYEVHEQRREVIVRAVGVRENFYKRLEEMRLKPFQ